MTVWARQYRTGQCLVGNHPLCSGRCTCACHQPAQPAAERSRGAGRGEEADPASGEAPGASQRERRRAIQAHLTEQAARRILFKLAEQQQQQQEAAAEPVDTVTVVLPLADYRFVTEYDPERERSASRRDMVTVLEEIQALLRDNRVQP